MIRLQDILKMPCICLICYQTRIKLVVIINIFLLQVALPDTASGPKVLNIQFDRMEIVLNVSLSVMNADEIQLQINGSHSNLDQVGKLYCT